MHRAICSGAQSRQANQEPFIARSIRRQSSAPDESARQWYLNWEFEPSASDPLHLLLSMKDLNTIDEKE